MPPRLIPKGIDGLCLCCLKPPQHIVLYKCDHAPICSKCFTILRISKDARCPVCTAESDTFIITEGKVHPSAAYTDFHTHTALRLKPLLWNEEFGSFFTSEVHIEELRRLNVFRCVKCQRKNEYKSLNALQLHLKDSHGGAYCEICMTASMNYFRNPVLYRLGDELDQHKHKDHPMCSFCDKHLLNEDHLFGHLRRHHLTCSLCEDASLPEAEESGDVQPRALGAEAYEYYSDLAVLNNHMRRWHYYCGRCDCAGVFHTSDALKTHTRNVHQLELAPPFAVEDGPRCTEHPLNEPGKSAGITVLNRAGDLGACAGVPTVLRYVPVGCRSLL